jgi:hypothetical protein
MVIESSLHAGMIVLCILMSHAICGKILRNPQKSGSAKVIPGISLAQITPLPVGRVYSLRGASVTPCPDEYTLLCRPSALPGMRIDAVFRMAYRASMGQLLLGLAHSYEDYRKISYTMT